MHFRKEARAFSTLFTIILIVVFMIVGAFISYMWVMASFYNMPENTSLLVFENIVFPSNNFTYFNLTILNPSNSVLDVNITGFNIFAENTNQTRFVNTTDPAVPFVIRKATRQNFTCKTNWSEFSGETVRIEPVAENASTRSYPYTTTKAELAIYGFSAKENVNYFNITVANSAESAINLTISEIDLLGLPVNSITPTPVTLIPGGSSQTFRCFFDWRLFTGENATITVKTVEGFEQDFTATTPFQAAYLILQPPVFDYTDTTYFNLIITSLQQSTATATPQSVNLTMADNTTITLSTIPPLNLTVAPVVLPNQSLTVKCLWDWNTHRSEKITVSAYTAEGFEVQNVTTTTPAAVEWNVNSLEFDINDLQHFSVNVNNTAISLQDITVTDVKLNQNSTTITPTPIAPGSNATIICTFNWTSYVGQIVDITVNVTYGTNQSSHVKTLRLPFFNVTNVSFSDFELGNPYINVTVVNSPHSPTSVTITQLDVKTDNGTLTVDGNLTNPKLNQSGYVLTAGAQTTFICPFDWSPFLGQNITVTAQTRQGLQMSLTLKVQ